MKNKEEEKEERKDGKKSTSTRRRAPCRDFFSLSLSLSVPENRAGLFRVLTLNPKP